MVDSGWLFAVGWFLAFSALAAVVVFMIRRGAVDKTKASDAFDEIIADAREKFGKK